MRGDTNAGYCSIRFFSASSGLASKGVMTTVVRNSKTKLIPIITAKTKYPKVCPFSVAAARKKSWKMVNTHREKIPVFMIGARTDATIAPMISLFFAMNL